jgi:hypothetical protein
MARANRDFLSAWDRWRIEADEYRELDDERVLVLAHMTGRGKTSGLELTQMGGPRREPVLLARRQGDEACPLLGS